MLRRVAGSLLTCAIAVGPVAAQANHNGSWHSIESRSSWSDGKLPKGFSLTITVEIKDGKMVYNSVNDTDKAHLGGMKFTAALDGTPAPIDNPRFNQIGVRKIDANNFEVLEMKDGDVIVGSYWTFFADGKTFVRRGVARDAQGRSKAFEEYFERK